MKTTQCSRLDCSTCRRYDLTCPEAPGLLRRCATVGCDMDDEMEYRRQMSMADADWMDEIGRWLHAAVIVLLIIVVCAQVAIWRGWLP